MKCSVFALVLTFMLAVPTAGSIGGPATVLAQQAAGPAAADSTPMLEALSLLPPEIDAFEFTHWSALKAVHGGADVTSASPLVERQRLLLDVARSEATTFPPGLDRLATWSDRWGWDTTDLEWQASCCGAPDFTKPAVSFGSVDAGVPNPSWTWCGSKLRSRVTASSWPRWSESPTIGRGAGSSAVVSGPPSSRRPKGRKPT